MQDRKYTTFLLLQVISDLMSHVVPFAVLKLFTGCRYRRHNLHCTLLHNLILGSGFSIEEMDVNFAFVRIEVRFGGCFNARIGFVSLNFLFLFLDLECL